MAKHHPPTKMHRNSPLLRRTPPQEEEEDAIGLICNNLLDKAMITAFKMLLLMTCRKTLRWAVTHGE